MLSSEFLFLAKKDYLTGEERLAQAIIRDWFSTLFNLVLKDRKEGLNRQDWLTWCKEISWAFTENARFWVEDVLEGNIKDLRLIATEFVRVLNEKKPVSIYGRIIQALLTKRLRLKDGKGHRAVSRKALVSIPPETYSHRSISQEEVNLTADAA